MYTRIREIAPKGARRQRRGRVRLLLLLLLCLGLSGCGALRILYGQGSTLSYWWLDRYVDFNGLQTPKVHQALERWFAWQHTQALPPVLGLLESVRTEAPRAEVAPERICGWWREALSLRDEAFREALPALAELALSLTPSQLTHIEQRQARSNAEYRDDFLQADAQERLEASADRAEDRLQMLYGRLSAAQSRQVLRWISQSPFDAERWGQERQRRQTELMSALREIQTQKLGQPAAEATLARWWAAAVHPRAPEYQAYVSRLEADNCRFAADFHRGASPAQKQHLIERLNTWSDDLKAFIPAP